MMKKEKNEKSDEIGNGLAAALSILRKEFGDGTVIQGNQIIKVEVIPTGAMSLDIALGVGGIPRGRITEVYGPEASGKTTLCLELIANVQRAGGTAAFIDVEQALDLNYAKSGPGVDIDKLLFSQPSCGEEALTIAEVLAKSGEVDLIVVDSVAALVPRVELEGEMGAANMGAQAKLMSQAMRKLNGVLKRSNTAMVFTNQIREKIGVMFGSPEMTPGGRALKFQASIRLDIRRVEALKSKTGNEKDAPRGNHVRVKVVKNKVASPHRVAEFDLIFGIGIDHISSLVDVAEQYEMVKRAGSSFKLGDKSYHGKEKLIEFLTTNEDAFKSLETEIRSKFQILPTVAALETDEDAEEAIKIDEE
jgi:recombination protein RecA